MRFAWLVKDYRICQRNFVGPITAPSSSIDWKVYFCGVANRRLSLKKAVDFHGNSYVTWGAA